MCKNVQPGLKDLLHVSEMPGFAHNQMNNRIMVSSKWERWFYIIFLFLTVKCA